MNPGHTLSRIVATPAEREYLEDRLYEYNRDQLGQDDGELFTFLIRDEAGDIIAGLTAWTWARACEIETLWVHPSWRREGYGRTLLQSAEQLARQRGCEVIYLDTYSFQAPKFYQKNGFEPFAQLDDFPPGHRRHFLVKRLSVARAD